MEHKHEFTRLDKVSAGCGKPYSIIQKCRICGYTEVIGHGETEKHSFHIKAIPSTCVRAGSREYKCSKCGFTRTDTLPLISHSYYSKGLLRVCRTCGKKKVSPPAICFITGIIFCSVCVAAGLIFVRKNKSNESQTITVSSEGYYLTDMSQMHLESKTDTFETSVDKCSSIEQKCLTGAYTREFHTSSNLQPDNDTENDTKKLDTEKFETEFTDTTEKIETTGETEGNNSKSNTETDIQSTAVPSSTEKEIVINSGEVVKNTVNVETTTYVDHEPKVTENITTVYKTSVETVSTETHTTTSMAKSTEDTVKKSTEKSSVAVMVTTTQQDTENAVTMPVTTTAETASAGKKELDYSGYAGGIYSGEEVIDLYSKGYNCEIITNNGASYLSSKTDLSAVIIKSDSYTCRLDKLHGEYILIFCQF